MSDFYIQLPLETDPQDILESEYEYLRTKIPGWEPNGANLDTLILQAHAIETSDLREVAASVPLAVFRYFGNSLVGVPPIDATPASVLTTWTMKDTAGYTINAGTLVGIRTAGDEIATFQVIDTFTIFPGDNNEADVLVIATTPGAASSGLGSIGAEMELIEPILDFVTTVVQQAITTGGEDAETDLAYLSRLRAEMQLLTPTPILPIDFSVLASRIGGVDRAYTLDGYNPGDESTGNERMVTVFPIDAAGLAVSGPIKSEIDALLESLRETNFVVHVADPEYSTINVTTTVVRKAGYDSAVVDAAVTAALQDYLDPANWGRQNIIGDFSNALPVDWVNQTILRHYELVSFVDGIDGVDYVDSLTFAIDPNVLGTANITLPGAVPLPLAGTINVTVNAP